MTAASSFLNSIHRFYRGTLFQAIILGLISFTQPGIWIALNNLGAGGQAEPQFVNAANVITFVIMVFVAPLSGMVGNIIGLRWVLIFGTIGYVPYSAALYCNSAFGTQWFLLFGSATCGLSAAALWTAEAAIGVGYPEPEKRGLYVGIWLSLQKLGSVIASAIQLSLNLDRDEKGKISPNTYLVLVGLQCLGLPLSFLIAPPHKLIREDGQKPVFNRGQRNLKGEAKAFWKISTTKRIALLIPIFISIQWGQTYQGNFLAAYFTVRARALAALIIAVVGIIVNPLVGWFLDNKSIRKSLRAKISWTSLTALFIAVWIWNIILQVRFSHSDPNLDYTSPGFGNGVAVYIIYRVAYEVGSVWVYWILGTYDVEVDKLALTTGLLRACESLGSAFSYAVGAVNSASLLTNLIVAAVMFIASVPTTTWATWLVPDKTELLPETDEESSATGVEVTISKELERSSG